MMTNKINAGGPAFPTEPNTQPGFYLHHGMSLRDYFAGQVITGFMAHTTSPVTYARNYADAAYVVADAMLAARKPLP